MTEMTLWRVTIGRSITLSRTYVIIGVVLALYGVILANLLPLLTANTAVLGNISLDIPKTVPFFSVAFLSLSATLFSMPVVMLFVYDKNNGVFEYLLSTGLDQLDIFKGYVKASLALVASLLLFSIVLNTVIGIFLGTSLMLLFGIAVLTFLIGVSVVFLMTVCMIAFSSLQKMHTGANSPLGIMIGIIPVFPALILPIVFPSYALIIDILIASVTILASIGLLLSIGKLIMREKLLP